MPQTTYVIGHRNPDADSICSAIAYANLKNKLSGEHKYTAARCGNSNARIDTILKFFNVPLPRFIGDVTPRVKDIMKRKVRLVTEQATCIEALNIIDEYDIRALPVVDDQNQVKGLLSIFNMGEFFIPKVREPREMRRVVTSVDAIVNSLQANVLNEEDSARVEEMFVRVGAMDIRSFGKFSSKEQVPSDRSIIVVGDRYDIQQKSIYSGVRLLVITGSLDVDPDVIELAKEKGVNLIVSPYDSATTAWTIRSASKISDLIDQKVYKFHAEETLLDVRKRITMMNAPIYLVVDDEDKLVGVFSKTDLLKPAQTNIVLVDHNELAQAVPGAREVNIAEVIDHHRLGNMPTTQPILFINEPVGSTCTIVADLYRRYNVEITPSIAGIMMSGIISDTLLLNSPTSTAKDKEILEWLSEIAQVKAKDLSETIFNAGSIIVSSEPHEVIVSDQKIYNEDEINYSVSQVEELGFANFWNNKDALIQALQEFRQEKELYFAALLITCINTQNSILLVSGEQEFLDRVDYSLIESNCIFELPGIVSRKKQLVPYLTGLIKQAPV